MAESKPTPSGVIPRQVDVPWSVVLAVSWGSLRRRILRSLITMSGVILAIAFLTYMMVHDAVVKALIAAHDDALNLLLQKARVDIYAAGGTDAMMLLLIGLSLLTCLVGIVNAMLMSVTERIKEIGTLKCLGAQDGFIVQTYFVESSLQGVLGTVVGILIGLFVALVIAWASFGGYVFQELPAAGAGIGKAMILALVIGSLMSVSASIAPAYWASKKQPVDAMRVEE